MNPLDEPIRKLFGRLNFLNFLIHFLEGRISRLQNEILEQLEQNTDSSLGFPFHGTSLLITDLTGPTDNGWLYHHVTGRVSVEKKEYIEMLGWFVSREAALAVAQSYETFETYLYDVSAAFLGANQDTVDISAFENNLPQDRDKAAWQSAIRGVFRRRSNAHLLNYIRNLGAELEAAESAKTNNRHINLVDWYEAAGQVRHAVTHSDLIISSKNLRKLTDAQMHILKHLFPGVETDDGYKLSLDSDSAKFAVKLFAEYGHAIFKSLSHKAGYDWRYLVNQQEDA